MNVSVRHIVARWQKKWFLKKLLLLVATTALVGVILYFIHQLTDVDERFLFVSGIFLSAMIAIALRPWPTDVQFARKFLEQHYSWLEYSLNLFWKDEVSSLENLQKHKIAERVKNQKSEWVLPGSWSAIFIIIILAGAGYYFTQNFTFRSSEYKESIKSLNQNLLSDKVVSDSAGNIPSVKEFKIAVSPPSYTGLRTYHSEKWIISAPENSRISWKIQMDREVENVELVINQAERKKFRLEEDNYHYLHTAGSSFIYQMVFTAAGLEYTSPFYSVEVTEDEKPEVLLEGVPRLVVVSSPDTSVSLNALIEDDYGISTAYFITTISSGDGEAVKFREKREKIIENHGRHWNGNMNLLPSELGMTYGDELYYYISASDNKAPASQSAKSATFILQIPDTAEVELVTAGGMAADLMPEYFRSQRQIIIDSEKLLKDKPKISKEEFNKRSNNLAHDQKALRLRYGQFIGLEDDSGIATETDAEAEATVDAYSHDHDHEEAHEMEALEQEEEDPLKKYLHAHDSEEEATFLYKTVKEKLKAALAVMWDAELHLRLYDPSGSLPYQYQSLKLIKEVQNHSRIYVQRIGFEPPPVKESVRLSGDLKEVDDLYHRVPQQKEPPLDDFLLSLNKIIMSGSAGAAFQANLNATIEYMTGKAEYDPLRIVDLLEAMRQLKNSPDVTKAVRVRDLLLKWKRNVSLPLAPNSNEEWNIKLLEKAGTR